MEIEIKPIKQTYMTIDKSAFKYYLGYEIGKMIQGKTSFTESDVNELYFMITKRFEPFFKERKEE